MIKDVPPAHYFMFAGSVVKIYHADKGQGLARHEHEYAHVTVCHSGRCVVRKDNVELEMTKGTQPVVLKENEWHEIEALEDGTVFCNIFAEGKQS